MKTLLTLILSTASLVAEPIVITPKGPPVFTAPSARDLYAVMLINPLTGNMLTVFVEAYNIPSAIAAASQPGLIAVAVWRVE